MSALDPRNHPEWVQREAEDFAADRRAIRRMRWLLALIIVGAFAVGVAAMARQAGWDCLL